MTARELEQVMKVFTRGEGVELELLRELAAVHSDEDRKQAEAMLKDRVALEEWLAPAGVRLRPIRSGVARLVPPPARSANQAQVKSAEEAPRSKSAQEALRWIEKLAARGH